MNRHIEDGLLRSEVQRARRATKCVRRAVRRARRNDDEAAIRFFEQEGRRLRTEARYA